MRWLTWHLALWSVLALSASESDGLADPSAIGDPPTPAPPAAPPALDIDSPPAELAPAIDPLWLSGRAVAAKHFVGLLAHGHYAAAAESYSGDVPAPRADELGMTWEQWVDRLGAFEDMVDTRPGRLYGQDAVRVTCAFEQGQADVQVAFDEGGCVTGFYLLPPAGQTLGDELYDAPGYVRTAAFSEQAVEIGTPPWALPGIVARPSGDGPFPGVVLVAGSGPQDADEASGPIKPFRDLSWGLASGAIAVLRYANRRYVYGGEIAGGLGYTADNEVVDDAVAAIARLRETPKVDPERIFVLGHGLAGGLLPRIAARAPGLAGGIILAGWTRPLEDVIVGRASYLAGLAETDPALGSLDVDALRAEATRIKDGATLAQAPVDAVLLGRPVAFWRDLRDYRPAAAAVPLDLPLLILQGERDYQVTLVDFAGWREALSGRPAAQFQTYPALGHPFLPAEGPPSPDDYKLVKHIPDEVIADIGDWIRRQPGRANG